MLRESPKALAKANGMAYDAARQTAPEVPGKEWWGDGDLHGVPGLLLGKELGVFLRV